MPSCLGYSARTLPGNHGNFFRKYAAKMLAITMMALIGLLKCRGTERQRMQQPDTSIQQVLLMEGEDIVWESSASEPHERRSRSGAELIPCNCRVAEGRYGAAISHVAVGAEWAPDPPWTEEASL